MQQPSQSNAAHVSADMGRGQQPDSSTNERTSSPAMTRLQSQQRRAMLQEEREATALMPMIEVAGAEGPMVVFRPWSDADINEAMIHVCNPKSNLTRWETDLRQFVKEYRPTMSELRRLMGKVLTNDYHKMQHVFNNARMTFRLSEPLYEDAKNVNFRDAVDVLINTVKEQFPLTLNLSYITSLSQGPQETCSSFLARLTGAFDTHSGLNRPNPMGAQPLTPYEVHLKEHFLSRMRPELVHMVRKACVTWKTCPLADILQHAEHAEDGVQRRDDQKKEGRQRKLEEAQLAMFNTRAEPAQETTRGRFGGGRGQTRGHTRGQGRQRGGGRRRTSRDYDPDVCHCCGKRGHWQADCPENTKTGPAFRTSD
ncbi:uncharacterized protein LOC130201189 [Pseudoliparis swirei]|uniref:uncharacterized protein LOC130201189 n=1 Tax=Pseudoliparis swirei TaxID=2059687 RepID=UPI0024BE83F1|nr:uncharacterized protein LOC130201189 [Pseudoliparis swirei]